MLGFHVITQYEQGLAFKWDKLQANIHEPGLIWLNPFSRRLVRVNMQTVVAAVPVQEATPGALQLRLLQTIVEVAADKNSTLVMPFPVELLRFFDQSTKSTASATAAAETLLAAQLSGPVGAEVAGPIAAVSAAPAAFPVSVPQPASAGATNGASGPVVR